MATTVSELLAKLGLDNAEYLKKMDDSISKMQDFGKKMTDVGKSLSKNLTAPLTALGGLSVAVFAGFDDQMRKVGAISGATGEDLQRLTDKAKELGATTRFSASEAAQGLEFMALAGFNAEQSIAAIPDVLNLAAAAAMDLGTAADIVTDTMSAFSIQADEAGRVSDVFAALQSKANTNVLQAGEAMKYAAANAAAMGQDIETVSALLGKFADAGLKGSMAGTTLNGIMRDLSANAENGKVAINGQAVSIANADGSYRSLMDIMADVEKATAGLTDIQRASALNAIFQAQSIRGVNVLMAAGVDSARDLEEQLRQASGTSKRMADEMEAGLGGAMRSLKSATEGLLLELGEKLAPVVQRVANIMSKAAGFFGKLTDRSQKLIVVIGGLLAVLGPVLAALGFFATTILPAMIAGFAALTSPIALVIGAVAALGAGIIYVIDNWEAIKERVTDIGWWKNALISMIQFLIKYSPFNLMLESINAIIRYFGGTEIINPMKEIGKGLEKLKTKTKEYKHEFGSFGDAVKNTAVKVMDSLGMMNREVDKGLKKNEEQQKRNNDAVDEYASGLSGAASAAQKLSYQLVNIAKFPPEDTRSEFRRYLDDWRGLQAHLDATTHKMKVAKVEIGTLTAGAGDMTENFQFMQNVLGGVHNMMEGLFMTMLNGGNAFDFILQMIKRLIAQLAAAAAMALILKLALPGSQIAGMAGSTGGMQIKEIMSAILQGKGMTRVGKATALATGGITTGPTLALIGDNPSGREAVIPFERMGEFMRMAGAGQGSQNITVSGVIRSGDIWLSNQQAQSNLVRRLGV